MAAPDTSQHRAEPVAQVEDHLGLIAWSQSQDLDCLDRGRRFGCLASGTAKTREPILTMPARCLRDAEIGS